ncbi:MAG: GNAT family N-acetyltransferase [Chromatiales bacterium]|nr:GNAT family N-acetyltransferase [Chromatiales bacterium]
MAGGVSVVETVRLVDLERDGDALLHLLDHYASDPMGGGKPLSPEVKQQLIPQLQSRSDYLGIIALHGEQAIGLINAFEGFSTFAAKPLMNIHDVIVASEYRGNGLAQRMMAKVEEIARERGCCKLTLEVLSNNHVAQAAYRKFGFGVYELDPEVGGAVFWEKALS